MYSYGKLEFPAEDDPRFEDLEEAEQEAAKASWDDGVYGVWEDESGELMAIVYERTVFNP
jgi:hypothetical protein